MSASDMDPVNESATLPSGATKNDVGMYWNWNCDASCWAEASSLMALTNTTLPSYSGITSSTTDEISTHGSQLNEWNSRYMGLPVASAAS